MKNCTLRRVWVGVQSSPPLFYVCALVAILLVGPSRAKADNYDYYVFASPVTTTTLNGVTEGVTGSFTFDSSSDSLTAVSITLASGLSSPSPFDGTYTIPSVSLPAYCGSCQSFTVYSGGSTLDVYFDSALGVSPDNLEETQWYAAVSPYIGFDAATGYAEFSAVPEPGSVIQLMTVVAIVGFLIRRKLVVGVLSKRSPNPTA
jgi:hypothetical protein